MKNMLKTPKYFNKKGLVSYLLTPLSIVYILLSRMRSYIHLKNIIRLKNKFVFCIGNVTVGGGGKTPTSIMLFKILTHDLNISPSEICFLSKGYGRKSSKMTVFFKVNATHSVYDIGDEAMILRDYCTTYIIKKYRHLKKYQNDILEKYIIMDDGYQNSLTHKDYLILLIDGLYKFGNEFIFPAGPLRESPQDAIARANYIFSVRNQFEDFPLLTYKYTFVPPKTHDKCLIFSGLANNNKFYQSVIDLGFIVEKSMEYPDHHFYTNSDMRKIILYAKKYNLQVITTRKDYVKLHVFYQKYVDIIDISFTQKEADKKNFIINIKKSLTKQNIIV